MIAAGLSHADALAETRREAAAVRAESRQARRQALAIQAETAVILEAVRAIAGEVLRTGGFAVAAPVDAEFRTSGNGTTGVAVSVRLADPAHAERAAAALAERFGRPGPPDAITVR